MLSLHAVTTALRAGTRYLNHVGQYTTDSVDRYNDHLNRDNSVAAVGGYLGSPADGRDMDELIDHARDALESAYAPYSEYRVGAALRTVDGAVYTGCNVENANYSNSLHAEEIAIGTAVSDGHREFDSIAVASAARDGVTPCGMCRQTLAEFCDDEFEVYCDAEGGVRTYRIGELLPDTISAAHLEGE